MSTFFETEESANKSVEERENAYKRPSNMWVTKETLILDNAKVASTSHRTSTPLPIPTYSALGDLLSRCENIHNYTGWFCMSCDSEVDATYEERCASCGVSLDGGNLTGDLIEKAKEEFITLNENAQGKEKSQ